MMTYSDPHPNGLTCGDCAHFKRCVMLFRQRATEAECDWIPSRFKEKECEYPSNRPNGSQEDRARSLDP